MQKLFINGTSLVINLKFWQNVISINQYNKKEPADEYVFKSPVVRFSR